MKDYIKQSALWLVRIIGSSLFSFLIVCVPMYAVRMTSSSIVAELAVNTVVGIIAASLMLMYLSYRTYRYSREKQSLKITVATFGVAVSVHLILAVLFHFSIPIFGSVSELANLFANGGEVRLGLKEQPMGTGILATLICDVFYFGAVIAGHIIGTRKREADRTELTGNK